MLLAMFAIFTMLYYRWFFAPHRFLFGCCFFTHHHIVLLSKAGNGDTDDQKYCG